MEKLAPWTKWAIASIAGLIMLSLLGSLFDQATRPTPEAQKWQKMADDNNQALKDIERASSLASCQSAKRTDCDQYRK